MDNSPSTRSNNWISYALSALGMALITGAIIAYFVLTPSGASALHLATTKQPERFTELYFNNTLQLPAQVTPGKSYTFSFHVTNQQYATTAYTANTNLLVGSTSQKLATTSFTLPQGTSKDVVVTFRAPIKPTQFEISVTLPAQNQTIYFRSAS